MIVRISFPSPIAPELAADLQKQAVYASPHITALAVTAARDALEVTVADGADEAEVRGKVERFVAPMVARFRALERKVMARTKRERDKEPLVGGVWDELSRRGWLYHLGRGQAGLAGPALRCARACDEAFRALGVSVYGAVDEQFPTLIPADVLARCGYFGSFPQSVSMVSHLPEDVDVIEEFRQANAEGQRLVVPRSDVFGVPEACLKPAVCYHAYLAREGRQLGEGDTITAVGTCYRYESKNIVGLERLWDFTMREIIFVGTDAWVRAKREDAIRRVTALIQEWDLDCEVETANDPFFATMYSAKTFWQVRGDLKYEIRLPVASASGGEHTIAAGSFNLHEDFFGRTFSITANDGKPASTGCTAFGIDRWVLGLFSQHGFDPARWPAPLAASVFGA